MPDFFLPLQLHEFEEKSSFRTRLISSGIVQPNALPTLDTHTHKEDTKKKFPSSDAVLGKKREDADCNWSSFTRRYPLLSSLFSRSKSSASTFRGKKMAGENGAAPRLSRCLQ